MRFPYSLKYKKMKLNFNLKQNRITQKFGENLLPIYRNMGMLGHNGIDFKYYHGEPIAFPCDIKGTVVRIEIDSAGGIGVDIVVNDNGFYYKLRFWHLKHWGVKVGDIIQPGQLFTLADNTGMSTGNHLHFGFKPVKYEQGRWVNILQDNQYFGGIDPMPFIVNTYKNKLIESIKAQMKVIQKVVGLLRELINKKI